MLIIIEYWFRSGLFVSRLGGVVVAAVGIKGRTVMRLATDK
jgi:hypothetical protein